MFKLLFSFQGRIGRGLYWAGCALAGGAVLLSFMLLGSESLGHKAAPDAAPGGGSVAASLVSLCLSLLSVWWGFATQVKRLHDRGRSGYWSLLPFLPAGMIGASLIGAVTADSSIEVALGSMMPWVVFWWVINLWFFVELGCLPGTPGANKYDNPRGALNPDPPAPPRASPAASLLGLIKTSTTAPTANTLANAEQAMAHAIAERGRSMAPAQAVRTPPASTPAPIGFGRKARADPS